MEDFKSNPIITRSTTLPAKIHDLKFRITPGNPNQAEYDDFDFIELGFVAMDSSLATSSIVEKYLIEIKDLDTDIVKKYIQPADDAKYTYWQRTFEYQEFGLYLGEDIPNGIVNARVFVTPINDLGPGNRSSFLLPFKNLQHISVQDQGLNPTGLVLAKYWNLFSVTPDEVYNRPKIMHIYLDVSEENIRLDKERLSAHELRYNAIGTYQEINQSMFRWSINKEYKRLDENDNFVDMTQEEILFMDTLMASFRNLYQQYISDLGQAQDEPFTFKISIQNPADHSDSIIIYLMKGQRWQM